MIQHGHGTLQNILDNYTLTHINHFLKEIDRAEQRLKISRIYEFRIAQADSKGFKESMARLHQTERLAQAKEQPQGAKPMTEKESEALQGQQHVKFTNLPADQQTAFAQERDSMWARIPAHLQEKARKLAGH